MRCGPSRLDLHQACAWRQREESGYLGTRGTMPIALQLPLKGCQRPVAAVQVTGPHSSVHPLGELRLVGPPLPSELG
jgi:hypothetical protein